MNDLPPWLRVLYPFEKHTFSGPQGEQNYVEEGSGVPIVFLHGNPTWSFFYRHLINELKGDYRCLAIDHIGCGLSSKPENLDYSLANHISNTCSWIEHLKLEKFHLVVHDWGGAIGFGVADKLKDRILSISVLNTAAFPFSKIPFRIAVCRLPILGEILVRKFNGFVEAAKKMTTVKPMSQAVKDGFGYPYSNWNHRVAVYRFVKDIPMSKTHSSWKTLKAIETSLTYWNEKPVQIIWGMRDWCFHKDILAEWTRRLPAAKVTQLENAGHYLIEDEPERVTKLVRMFVSQS